jgi:hypothetical protein
MNDANVTRMTELVYRRLNDPIHLFGRDLPATLWYVILPLVLLVAFFYVGWMYVKDSRTVGPWWATLLGLLRSAVYVLLAGVFLLPAYQTWEQTEIRSKVLVVFDVSHSLTAVVDDVPGEGVSPASLPTRQDKVLRFLMDEKVGFLAGLEKKNPVTVYRFASQKDENFLHLAEGAALTREEREERLNDPKAAEAAPEPRPLRPEMWSAWLRPQAAVTAPDDWDEADKARLARLVESNRKLAAAGFFSGTSLSDSLLAVLNREASNMLQGIVVFTDGRSTQGAVQAFNDLKQRCESANPKIPVFVVGVGEARPQIRLEIADLRAPGQVQPDDPWRAAVEVYGEGLADQEFPVFLDVTHTKKGRDGKEEPLPLFLVEADDGKGAARKEPRAEVPLGNQVTLKPAAPPKFDRSTPPRATVEFTLEPAALAAAAGVALDPKKKWELGETLEGELRLRARVPRDKREVFLAKEHVSDAADVRVLKRPLRVLLFASAPTRDYQFVRTLFVREAEKKRAELTIHLQTPPGRAERRMGIVQDVPPERLLPSFPDRLDSDKAEDRLLDLSEYDVIIAFDPDWTQLTDQQLKLVDRWVEKGGGLVLLGGPINTLQLARPGSNKERLKPILDLYPVVLKDIRIEEMDRSATDPWPLNFEGATPEMEFLRLDEGGEKGPPPFLSDWQEFFYGPNRTGPVLRGFYTYYPVESAKAGTLVVARFGDPQAKLKDGTTQMPYLVTTDPASGRRVVWIGSGETWRLRQYREAFHERFWTKLARYAGARNQGRLNRRITLNMGRVFTANRPVDVEVKVEARGDEPAGRGDRAPKIFVQLPTGVPEGAMKTEVEMRAKPGRDGEYTATLRPPLPGEYGLQVKLPDPRDPGRYLEADSVSQRITVKEANPEMDNTRPDFDTMYRLASPAAEVVARMTDDAARQELRRRLAPPKLEQPAEKAASPEPGAAPEESFRLYFDLQNAELIPACMVTKQDTRRSRGPVQDLWDEGFTLWENSAGQPVKMSYVLVAAVGLLSLEWLTRKLLRLA